MSERTILWKGAFVGLFFFMTCQLGFSQEILWKGEELQSSNYKSINGEIVIRTPTDTIRARKARLYNEPKKAVLKENVSLVRTGSIVTGDSAIYYVTTKLAQIMGNAVITNAEGKIKASAFDYSLITKQLSSNSFTEGTANGIRFSADRSIIATSNNQITLIGHAKWENDTIKGVADTIFLDKASNKLTMSRAARIMYKYKKDEEVAGSLIELDLKANKISNIKGSVIKRTDAIIKAKNIEQKGDDYYLIKDVMVQSKDSSITSTGMKAVVKKKSTQMSGNTITTLIDKEKNKIHIHSPEVVTADDSGRSKYNFFKLVNIRGYFSGFCDSLSVLKNDSVREIYMYRDVHLQNDSMYIEGDTVELFQDSTREIIRARRNAMMVMITPPERVNVITGTFIQLTKTRKQSEVYARGGTESYLWNDEKSNIGLNHTESVSQRALIKEKKVTKVTAVGSVKSTFSPFKKVSYSYIDAPTTKMNETYKADSLSEGLKPVPHFIKSRKGKR